MKMYTFVINIYALTILLSLIYLAVSAGVIRTALRKALPGKAPKKDWPAVTILKPLKGIDDCLEDNLRSFMELDYEAVEIIFGLQDKNDPALTIVNKLRSEYPQVHTQLIINERTSGLNPKVNNMINMYAHARHPLILISDSNTRVENDYLQRMVAGLDDPSVGVVTSTVRGVGAKNFASVMENLHLNTFITPNVFVAARLVNIPIVIGKAILIRRETLRDIGGFHAFKLYLAEDYLIGLRSKEKGWHVKTINAFVNNVNQFWSLKRFFNRHTRWAKMRRHMHLHHYLLESMSNPVAMSFILMALRFDGIGVLQFALVTLLKLIYDAYVSAQMKSDLRWYHYPAGILKDLIIGVIWFVPFVSYKVKWRDNHLRISRYSYLQPV